MVLRRMGTSLIGGRGAQWLRELNERHAWSHNDYFHSWILANLPDRRGRALDMGCGRGGLVRALAPHFRARRRGRCRCGHAPNRRGHVWRRRQRIDHGSSTGFVGRRFDRSSDHGRRPASSRYRRCLASCQANSCAGRASAHRRACATAKRTRSAVGFGLHRDQSIDRIHPPPMAESGDSTTATVPGQGSGVELRRDRPHGGEAAPGRGDATPHRFSTHNRVDEAEVQFIATARGVPTTASWVSSIFRQSRPGIAHPIRLLRRVIGGHAVHRDASGVRVDPADRRRRSARRMPDSQSIRSTAGPDCRVQTDFSR